MDLFVHHISSTIQFLTFGKLLLQKKRTEFYKWFFRYSALLNCLFQLIFIFLHLISAHNNSPVTQQITNMSAKTPPNSRLITNYTLCGRFMFSVLRTKQNPWLAVTNKKHYNFRSVFYWGKKCTSFPLPAVVFCCHGSLQALNNSLALIIPPQWNPLLLVWTPTLKTLFRSL